MTQSEFDAAVGLLKRYVAQLQFVANDQFPDGMSCDPGDEPSWMTSGDALDNIRLRIVKDSISNVMGAFDNLQKCLGLPRGHEPLYSRFIAGKCR
jgi:hypothetical protein